MNARKLIEIRQNFNVQDTFLTVTSAVETNMALKKQQHTTSRIFNFLNATVPTPLYFCYGIRPVVRCSIYILVEGIELFSMQNHKMLCRKRNVC